MNMIIQHIGLRIFTTKQDFLSVRAYARSLLLLLFACNIPLLYAADFKESLLDLYIGQSEILSIRNVSRVSVGNGALVDVKVLEDTGQILLLAKATGITDLRVWQKNGSQKRYQLRVLQQSPEMVLQQVQSHLSDIEGVQARLAGSQIVIEGQSLRSQDVQRVNVIAKQFPNVSNHVSAGGVTLRSMIYFDVKVLEIKKTGLQQIGVEWEAFTQGPTFGYLGGVGNTSFRDNNSGSSGSSFQDFENLAIAAGTGNVFLGMSTMLKTKINLMKNKGYARILAEPKLSCRSGGKAEFQVGGQLPYETTSALGSSNVIFKDFGIILNVEPVADSEGYIATKVMVEVSNPDFSRTVRGLPGFSRRKTSTELNLRSGQTMVISGLIDSRSSKGVNKMPGVGDIPVLGELFKSRAFENEETDLVIFLTPTIIDPEHKINQDALSRVADMKQRADKNLRFSLMD